MSQAVRFIRKNGKVIPIGAKAVGAGRAAKAAKTAAHLAGTAAGVAAITRRPAEKKPQIKVNRALDITGLGLSVASGALAASTFAGGAKGLLGGHAAAHAIDVVGVSANVASVAGRGKKKERIEQAAKNEARNFLIGNAVYAAGVLGVKKNREAALGYAKKILDFGRKALRVKV